MSKPLPQRIASDDCAVKIGGTVYYPHEKEWVEMFVGMSVGEAQAVAKLTRLGSEIAAGIDDPAEAERIAGLIDEHFDFVTAALAQRVKTWNWTDDSGLPLPLPDSTPGPLKRLRSEELLWLLQATQGETPGARKKGLRPSRTTSLGTP